MKKNNIYYSVFILFLGISACKNDSSKRKNMENNDSIHTNAIRQLSYFKHQLKETTTGQGIYWWDIENFKAYKDENLTSLDNSNVDNYISSKKTNAKYYPIIELRYASEGISIHLTFEDLGDQTSSFIMSTIKKNKVVDEVDLWKLTGAESIMDVANFVTLEGGVSKGKPYTLRTFSNNFREGYYNVHVLLNGKIEVEEFEIPEGDIP